MTFGKVSAGLLVALIALACTSERDGQFSGVACNDGTGAVDCCPASAREDAPCNSNGARCWTPCIQGMHGERTCDGTKWVAGKGGYPCGECANGVNCCPAGSAAGGLCGAEGMQCSTLCANGSRNQLQCTNAHWVDQGVVSCGG